MVAALVMTEWGVLRFFSMDYFCYFSCWYFLKDRPYFRRKFDSDCSQLRCFRLGKPNLCTDVSFMLSGGSRYLLLSSFLIPPHDISMDYKFFALLIGLSGWLKVSSGVFSRVARWSSGRKFSLSGFLDSPYFPYANSIDHWNFSSLDEK